MRWMQLQSASRRSPPGAGAHNPHPAGSPLARIFYFATYIRIMDDDLQEESPLLEDLEDEELEEEDEKY
jgi:hypothetical protein